jgi:hypothetical protein
VGPVKRARGRGGGLGSFDVFGDGFSVRVAVGGVAGGSVGRATAEASPPDRQAARSSTATAALAVRFMCTRMTLERLLELASA